LKGNKRKTSGSSMGAPIAQSSSSAQAAENKDANKLVVVGTSNTGTRAVASVDIAVLHDDDEDIQ
jgi:chemotaxis response regulator CheB